MMKSLTCKVPLVPTAVKSIVKLDVNEEWKVADLSSNQCRDALHERMTPASLKTVLGKAKTVLGSS